MLGPKGMFRKFWVGKHFIFLKGMCAVGFPFWVGFVQVLAMLGAQGGDGSCQREPSPTFLSEVGHGAGVVSRKMSNRRFCF